MPPLSVQIITYDSVSQKEVQHQYIVQTKHPRWEMIKIFLHAFLHLRFR
jgi:hypothetical protein